MDFISNKANLIKNKYLWSKYGLTLDYWNNMLLEQDNKCWICQQVPKSGRLCVDHRHVRGYKHMGPTDKFKEVRGALCFMCNTMLHGVEKRKKGRFYLNRMVEYFKQFKIVGDL